MKENLWNVAPFIHKKSMKFAKKRKIDVKTTYLIRGVIFPVPLIQYQVVHSPSKSIWEDPVGWKVSVRTLKGIRELEIMFSLA